MPANTERQSSLVKMSAARSYPSELLPLLQLVLATLADIDFEHQSDIETVRNSSADEWLKKATIRTLEERHQQRRVSYIRQLERLQRQAHALAA
ncbi:hypothetical protein JKG68_07400 [Microvirga aerilata]|uniref:Uncharacterized protein n=1 Tax=Microvirga aerilata TaxID=670292 RepID=A0A937CXD3_9HYPH|nr:hypothetical protein [Microvirga aerilata]MBL0403784.1 hypothetical protein [Microvirga aerilata]